MFLQTDQDWESYCHDFWKVPSISKVTADIFKTNLISLKKGKGTCNT